MITTPYSSDTKYNFGDLLSLIATSAFYHPKKEIRDFLLPQLLKLNDQSYGENARNSLKSSLLGLNNDDREFVCATYPIVKKYAPKSTEYHVKIYDYTYLIQNNLTLKIIEKESASQPQGSWYFFPEAIPAGQYTPPVQVTLSHREEIKEQTKEELLEASNTSIITREKAESLIEYYQSPKVKASLNDMFSLLIFARNRESSLWTWSSEVSRWWNVFQKDRIYKILQAAKMGVAPKKVLLFLQTQLNKTSLRSPLWLTHSGWFKSRMIDCFDELSLKEKKHKIVYSMEIKLKDLLELPLNPWSIGGDTGPIISIKGLKHPDSFISKHRAHINIGGDSDTNKIFNYTWDEEDKIAVLSPVNTEGTIKLLAHIEKNSLIKMNGSSGKYYSNHYTPNMVIQLKSIKDRPIHLPFIASSTPELCNWFTGPMENDMSNLFDLPRYVKVEISKWLMPYRTWLDEVYLELLAEKTNDPLENQHIGEPFQEYTIYCEKGWHHFFPI